MSLCYDFQKWTIISLAAFAISLTVGLTQYAYGQSQNQNSNSTFNPRSTDCIISWTEKLVILNLDCREQADAITYFLDVGYEIKATVVIPYGTLKSMMYMQKEQ